MHPACRAQGMPLWGKYQDKLYNYHSYRWRAYLLQACHRLQLPPKKAMSHSHARQDLCACLASQYQPPPQAAFPLRALYQQKPSPASLYGQQGGWQSVLSGPSGHHDNHAHAHRLTHYRWRAVSDYQAGYGLVHNYSQA